MINLVLAPSQQLSAEPFTTGDIIAKYAGITHHAINVMVNQQYGRLKRAGAGKVSFKMKPKPSGQKAKVFLLNEQQATLLITFLKNTPREADFKEELVRQFTSMKRELAKRRVMFEVGKETSKELNTAITNSEIDMHGHEFSAFNSLVYKQALGVSIGKLRQARGIPKADAITHYLSADEADAVRRGKDQVITLLGLKMDYQQVKSAIQRQGIIYQVQLTLPTKPKEVLQ